ncbi:MAG: TerC family protein [Bacillota bacterium]
MSFGSLALWVAFNAFVLAMLALDLGVFHRKPREVSTREAAVWSLVWVALAMVFNLALGFWQGRDLALEFLTGYIIEKSLSVDNVFVFVMIFRYFSVPPRYQHRVLYWGIVGALVMRGAFIAAGVTLLARFDWVIYVFGLFLVLTGLKMARSKQSAGPEPEANPVIGFFRRVFPVTDGYRGHRFFVREDRRLFATPLFLVLLMVETTDLVFALDSIPAIFGVTRDPFVVYSSNVFAILGLRALYFLLAGVMDLFRYLRTGLAVILVFIGLKMLLYDLYHLPVTVSLGVVLGILAVSVSASVLTSPRVRVGGSARVERARTTRTRRE